MTGPGDSRDLRLAVRLTEVALRAWPDDVLDRDGPALRATLLGALRAARDRGRIPLARAVLAESWVLVREGVSLKMTEGRRPPRRVESRLSGTVKGWGADLRVAARTLVRSPAFTLVAGCTLAIGLGSNALVFDLFDRVLLQPPPYHQPETLAVVWGTLGESRDPVPLPGPDAAAVAERSAAIGGVAFFGRSRDATLSMDGSGEPEHVVMARVSPDAFSVLGVTPTLGPGLLAADDAGVAPSSTPLVLSDRTWRRAFGADDDVVGRQARLEGRLVTVVGVMPPGFRLSLPPGSGLGADPDVWVPLGVPLAQLDRGDGRRIDQDSDNTGAVVVRLAAGASPARAAEDIARVGAELRHEVDGYDEAEFGLRLAPLHADATARARPLLLSLLLGALGSFLVACLSVAGIILARLVGRERELAVQTALGAGTWRVMRLLLTECFLLVATGGLLAAGMVWLGAPYLEHLVPAEVRALAAPPGALPWRFLATGLAVTAAFLAVVVAVRARVALFSPGGFTSLRGRFTRSRAREAVVVLEVALSLALVVGAGLLLRTADALRHVDLGFEPQSALVFNASLRASARTGGPAARARLVREMEEAARTVPGVRAVGAAGTLPLSGRRWRQPWGLPGEPATAWSARRADFRTVTSGYFEAVGTRLLEGRTFTSDEDLNERQRVVVVDRTLARSVAPGASAVGATIGIPLDGREVEARIVGVVESVRSDDPSVPGGPTIYVPYRQEASTDVSFVVRTTGNPEGEVARLRTALRGAVPDLAVSRMLPMADYVRARVAPTHFGLTLLTTYALLALVSAALGLYGVVAWEVGRRRRELGVRMAVGASGARVQREVLARGARLGTLGIAAGVTLAAPAVGVFRRIVWGVGILDPTTWLSALAVVLGVTLLASWLPARRASRVPPADALRAE